MTCNHSYSGEHAFIPTAPKNGYELNKCVHCGYEQNVSKGIFIKKVEE